MSTYNFVLIGEAGSGKTEIATNLVLRLTEDMLVPVCLIDMDQTKRMFRVRDPSSLLGKGHVRMMVNPELWDSPLMPRGVASLFKDDSICCAFDAGGNIMGAAMLGQLVGLMVEKNTSYHYVINPCRAFSGSVEDILESLGTIPISVRIPAEGPKFTANPFMGEYTTPELTMEYVKRLEAELSKAGLKLHGLTVSERFFGGVRKLTGLPTLELSTFIDKSYVWMKRLVWRSIGGSPYES